MWRLTWPVILAGMSAPLVGVADTAVMGRMPNSDYIAAVALGAMVISAAYWLFGFLRMGTTGMTSQALGADDQGEADALLSRALIAGVAGGVLLILLQWPIFRVAFLVSPASAEVEASASLYMATVSETGWPYVQHRGGDAGFVSVLDESTIGWVERTGNRQYVGTGNLTDDGRVALILMDYPSRTRLKIWGRATHHPDPSPELLERLGAEGIRADGAITIEVVATAWNCPKYITPRFTEAQVAQVTRPLADRIAELEDELERLRG